MKKELSKILADHQKGEAVYFGMSWDNFKKAVSISLRILKDHPISKIGLGSGSYDTLSKWYRVQSDKVEAFLICVDFLERQNQKKISEVISRWTFYSEIIPNISEYQVMKIASRAKPPTENTDQLLDNPFSLGDQEMQIISMYVIKSLTSDKERSEIIKRAFEFSSNFGNIMGFDKISDVWMNNPDENKVVKLVSAVMSMLFLRDLNSMVELASNNQNKEGDSK